MNDVKAARSAADELSKYAADRDAPVLGAMWAHATGAVLLAEGDARALATLRKAWKTWQEVDAPYERARARALMGQACRELGDEDGAQLELDAARWVFQQPGAGPDLARVEALLRPASSGAPGGLTMRELQVLRLIATGRPTARSPRTCSWRENRGTSRQQHLHEAGLVQPRRSDGVCLRARSGVGRGYWL